MNARVRLLTHILMYIILPLMLVFVVLSVMDFRKAQDIFAQQIEYELLLLTDAQVREFSNSIRVMHSIVAHIAEDATTQKLLYEAGLTHTKQAGRRLEQNIFFPIAMERIERVVRNFEYAASAGLVDTQGNVIAHLSSSFIGSNVADRAYFKKAVQGDHSFENIESRATGELVSVFAKPVFFNYEIVGVAYVVLDLEKISKATIDTVNFHKSGNAYVFSNTGRCMMHANKEYKGVDYSSLYWVQEVLESPRGIVHYTWQGEEKIGAYMRVPDSDWTVVISGIKETIFVPIYASFSKGFIVASMMIVLLCLIFVLLHKIKGLIARRQEAFNDLEKERLLFLQILEDCPIAMGIYNDYTEIVVANPALTALTGFTVYDDITTMFDDVDTPLLTDIFETKLPLRNHDLTIYDVSGQPIYVRLHLSLIEYHNKTAVLICGQDITSLTLSVQQAQEYLQAKNTFMSCMSHEIRTPMNAVLGMLYLLQQTRLSYEQEQYVLKIQAAATNLLGIINEILDFSKIEAGKMTLEVSDFFLSDVIRHLSDLFSFAAEQKQIVLFFFLSPHIPNALRGDKLRLSQILTNLIGNAIKFTHAGQVVVYVHLVSAANGQVSINFIVRDTGVGMDEEQLRHIYEPFRQADDSVSRKYGGTGLGLTITKNLLEMMGGSMSVESSPGLGTTFTFTLNFSQAQQPSSLPPLNSLKILVVDDNSTDREFLGNLLTVHTVHMAETGQSAIQDIVREATRGMSYDLVFLDWVMPDMGGNKFIQHLQHTMAGQKTPIIIVISAHEVQDLVEQMINLHISVFLPKPITAFAVQNSIIYALNSARTATLTVHSGDSLKLSKNFMDAKILLVEDTPANIEVASKILSNMGCKVTVAMNGEEACTMVQEEDFELVLMDIHMPVLDGLKATRKIRALPEKKYADLPIIAMTALALDEEKAACYAAGMNAHMAKPFVPKELLALLERYLPINERAVQALSSATEDAEKSDGKSILPPMDGFDTALGLLYLADNVDMYLQQLKMFSAQYGDYAEKIGAALAKGDDADAKKMVHTLKGVSKMFGAVSVSDACKELEISIRSDFTLRIREAVQTLTRELDRVVLTLSNFPFEQYSKTEQAVTVFADDEQEKAFVAEKITEIYQLIDEDLGAVLTLVEEMDQIIGSSASKASLAPIKYAIAQCDPVLLKKEVRHLLEQLEHYNGEVS